MKLNQAQMSRLLPLQIKLQSAKGRYEAERKAPDLSPGLYAIPFLKEHSYIYST